MRTQACSDGEVMSLPSTRSADICQDEDHPQAFLANAHRRWGFRLVVNSVWPSVIKYRFSAARSSVTYKFRILRNAVIAGEALPLPRERLNRWSRQFARFFRWREYQGLDVGSTRNDRCGTYLLQVDVNTSVHSFTASLTVPWADEHVPLQLVDTRVCTYM